MKLINRISTPLGFHVVTDRPAQTIIIANKV